MTVSWAVLLMDPYGLEAVQQNRPPSSGKASAITRVQISSDKKQTNNNHHEYAFNDQIVYDPKS